MRSRLFMLSLMATVALLALAPASLAQGVQGQAGASNMAHLGLTSDCPMHPDAWGKVTYGLSGPTLYIVLNGHRLPTDGEYRLYYGNNQYVTARANDGGNLQINATVSGSGVPSDARFEIVHIHDNADGDTGEHDMTSCVILVSQPHGYTYVP
jgi:hypothetical protein